VTICESGVPHAFDPDTHFCCKMRYMRQNGVATSIPGDWKGPSTFVKQKNVIAEAVAAGYDPQPMTKRPHYGPV
jgi:hypothetical protein